MRVFVKELLSSSAAKVFDEKGRKAVVAYSFKPFQNGSDYDGKVCGWSSERSLLTEQGTLVAGKEMSSFVANPIFVSRLHDFLKLNSHSDKGLCSLAAFQKEGWMPIEDSRAMTPFGRTPDPEDIIGYVEVREGIIIPKSFQPMPTYRMLSTLGLLKLSDSLFKEFNSTYK